MKSVKQMLLGITVILVAIWCAVMNGDTGSWLGAASIILMPIGLLIAVLGMLRKE